MAATLTNTIKAEAQRLGFDFAGVTTPNPPATFPVYQSWLEAGQHGEMGYLAADRALERRCDPSLILPECQSILVLGIRHDKPAGTQPVKSTRPQGRVAAYAGGEDYHDVLPERLKAMVAFIEAEVGAPVANRWYTDTGPILERDLAHRAGLGWVGKNSMLINPKLGSYFLLAEILLGVKLEPDAAFVTDHCGSCTRCLDACPTGCILPNRTLDARRCISYLTIELKGPIPLELRPQLKDWVFGCDICQQVCPWNVRFAPEKGDPAFTPHKEIPTVDLQAELSLSPQEFNAKFKGNPVIRAKRRGYLRNVAVALGNAGSAASIPALKAALLNDSEALVRGHAAWALSRIGGKEALEILSLAMESENDAWVLDEIYAALEDSATSG
jgi:epoxyqueuosine reductase